MTEESVGPRLINVSELCRTCMSQENIMFDLSESEIINGEYVKFSEMLDVFKSVQELDNDNVPQKICMECAEHLRNAFSFEKKALQSQNFLINIMITLNRCDESQNIGVFIKGLSNNDAEVEELTPKIPVYVIKQEDTSPINKPRTQSSRMKEVSSKFVQIPNQPETVARKLKLKDVTIKKLSNNGHTDAQTKENTPQAKQEVNIDKKIKQLVEDGVLMNKNNKNSTTSLLNRMVRPQCSKCCKKFNSKAAFFKHFDREHTDKFHSSLPTACNICDVSFDSCEELKEHNISVHFTVLHRKMNRKKNRSDEKRKPKICGVCRKVFPYLYQLMRHMKEVHSYYFDDIDCKKCLGEYLSHSNLRIHLTKCNLNNEMMPCDICSDVQHDSMGEYLKHHADLHQLYICTYCSRGFHDLDALHSHTKIMHDESKKLFQCTFCPKNFMNRWVMVKHVKNTHELDLGCLVCGFCNDVPYSGVKDLLEHLQEKHLDDTYEMYQQQKEQTRETKMKDESQSEESVSKLVGTNVLRYSNYILLKENQQPNDTSNIIIKQETNASNEENTQDSNNTSLATNNPAYNVFCRTCSKVFTSMAEYKKHYATHGVRVFKYRYVKKPKTERSYLCEVCSKSFSQRINLEQHVNSHIMETLHCLRCGYDAEDQSKMRDHFKTCRMFEVTLVCSVCGKTFATRSGLTTHMKLHQFKARFQCPSCNRRFNTNQRMKSHILVVHSNIRPYLCNICGKRFPNKDHLNKHTRSIHNKERNFVCEVCEKSYFQSSHLIKHMLSHSASSKPTFTCPYCTNTYSASYSLKKHIKSHHFELENKKQLKEQEIYKKQLEDFNNSTNRIELPRTCQKYTSKIAVGISNKEYCILNSEVKTEHYNETLETIEGGDEEEIGELPKQLNIPIEEIYGDIMEDDINVVIVSSDDAVMTDFIKLENN